MIWYIWGTTTTITTWMATRRTSTPGTSRGQDGVGQNYQTVVRRSTRSRTRRTRKRARTASKAARPEVGRHPKTYNSNYNRSKDRFYFTGEWRWSISNGQRIGRYRRSHRPVIHQTAWARQTTTGVYCRPAALLLPLQIPIPPRTGARFNALVAEYLGPGLKIQDTSICRQSARWCTILLFNSNKPPKKGFLKHYTSQELGELLSSMTPDRDPWVSLVF